MAGDCCNVADVGKDVLFPIGVVLFTLLWLLFGRHPFSGSWFVVVCNSMSLDRANMDWPQPIPKLKCMFGSQSCLQHRTDGSVRAHFVTSCFFSPGNLTV